jgi:hypothetical protein
MQTTQPLENGGISSINLSSFENLSGLKRNDIQTTQPPENGRY